MSQPDDSEILVGKWDCAYGHPGQDGEATKCANCGAPRPDNVEFYLPTDARVVTDAAGIAAAKAGSDLICKSCDSSVAAGQTICPQCSAPLDANKCQAVVNYASRDQVPTESSRTRQQRERRTPPSRSPQRPSAGGGDFGGRGNTALLIVGLVILAILTVAGGWWFLMPHPVKLTVQDISWQRTIQIQEERTVQEEDWSVPTGGRATGNYQAVHHHDSRKVGERAIKCHREGDRVKTGVRRFACHSSGHREKTGTRSFTCHSGGHREQTGTRRYACGTKSLGNGRFEQKYCSEPTYSTRSCSHSCSEDVYTTRSCTHDCQEDVYGYESCRHACSEDIMQPFPVYATKYRFDVERWFELPAVQTNGQGTALKWPELNLSRRQREGSRQETRRVTFRSAEGRVYTFVDPPTDYWSSLRQGMHCTAMISGTGKFNEKPVCN